MPSEKENSVKKVKTAKPKQDTDKTTTEPQEDPDAKLFQKGAPPPRQPNPLQKARPTAPKPEPRPWEEIQLAETRVAKMADEKKAGDKDDPAERLGMSKIGLTKGVPLEEPPKDETPEEVPEPIIEEAIQDGKSLEEPTESLDGLDEAPSGKLPPPPIPPELKGKSVEPPKPPKEDPANKKELELEEVEVKQGDKTVKIMRVKSSAITPAEEEDDELDPAVEAAFGLKPSGGRRKSPPAIEKPKAVPEKDDDAPTGPIRIRPGERVRRSAGLGVDVELDEETIRKLSAPVLPASFGYPNRAMHARFRRYVLFLIIPVLFLLVLFVMKLVTPVTLLLVVFMLIVMLISLYVYGISPFYTNHWVTKSAVLLKHGLYFDARISLHDIRSVRLYEDRAGPMGIRVDRDRRLFAMSDRKDMVEIVLKDPITVASFHNVRSVITNVEAPPTFIRTVKSAISSLGQEPGGREDENGRRENPDEDEEV